MSDYRDEFRGHVPPSSLEGEQAVLGAMLIERGAIESAAQVLKPTDFYRDAHRVVYEAIMALYDKDEPVDLLSVKELLAAQKVLENIGGATYLLQLTNAVPSAANVEHYAGIVRSKAILRRLIDAGNQITALARDEEREVEQTVAECGKAFEKASAAAVRRHRQSMRSIIDAEFEELEKAAENPDRLNGVPTGLFDLDRATNGWQRGDLILVGARPGVGKSAIAGNTFALTALQAGKRVAIFSLEMTRGQIVRRMIGARSKVSLTHMRRGTVQDDEWRRIGQTCSDLSDLSCEIDDDPDVTPTQIRLRLRQMERQGGKLDLVIVDYLALVQSEFKGREGDWQAVDDVAMRLKRIAKEFDAPVIALTQLNKEIDKRGDGRPVLGDIKQAGEAHADIVIFLWPDRRMSEESEVRKVWLTIGKQRNGQLGDIPLAYHPAWTRFDQMADDQWEEESLPKLLPRRTTGPTPEATTSNGTHTTPRSPYKESREDSTAGDGSALDIVGWNPSHANNGNG